MKGKKPFGKLKKAFFSVRTRGKLEHRKIQHSLLLDKGVLLAHVRQNGEGELVCEAKKSIPETLKKAGAKEAKVLKLESTTYDSVLEKTFNR